MFYNDPLDISKEAWAEVLRDTAVTTEPDLDILRLVYESKSHGIRASEIAAKLRLPHHGEINLRVSEFAMRVIVKTGTQPPLRENGNPRWWHVPFLGYDQEGGWFPWIMRPELASAFAEVFAGESSFELVYAGEMTIEDVSSLSEGALKQVFVNRYERSRHARRLCIAHFGSRCVVCGFDFERVYGEAGRDKIEVHHLVPLSEIGQEYQVDPIRDLRPVCPNCHAVIHSRREPFTIEEVRGMVMASRSGEGPSA